ncbi:nucleolar protein 8 [Anopheles sinensis]|uniref:Nucleolar protein 8 n=1 Tax=Anopheles sinensis TaxID=74873 RepID=A0A084VBR3_ANOSI|nr:nucleolar protein 8 [Anopheles sinensis]
MERTKWKPGRAAGGQGRDPFLSRLQNFHRGAARKLQRLGGGKFCGFVSGRSVPGHRQFQGSSFGEGPQCRTIKVYLEIIHIL